MPEWTAELLAQRAFDLSLLDERQTQDLWSQLGSRDVPVDTMKQHLLRRELLSSFQLERLLRGETSGYFYGDYKVMYMIGAGTFARVYRAVHKVTGQGAGVKVLRGRLAAEEPQREQFLREAELGKALRHPNIVQIIEVAMEGNQPYMIMEFVEGRTLREFIRTAPKIEPLDAVKLMTDMAAGLDFAFRAGIAHRDLSASNVLISSQKQAKLADFGLAAADPELTDEALAEAPNPRTVDYAGLEKATGVKKNDPRSDIYFMGCIYYHLLAGKGPLLETKDRLQRLSRQRFLDVKPLLEVAPNTPRSLATVVSRAMELNPIERYQKPGEMLGELKLISRNLAEGRGDAPVKVESQSSLMIVESNSQLQDVLRDKLKQLGFRVLMTSDPGRPLSWFSTQPLPPADCVVFSTGELKEEALEAFNVFGMHPETRNTPAILLLGEKQKAWQAQARLAEHRVVLTAPLRMNEFREAVERVLAVKIAETPSDAAETSS